MAFAGAPASKYTKPFGVRVARALNLLTKASAAEYGPSVVRVNAVNPAPTSIEGTDAMGEGQEPLATQAPAGCGRDSRRDRLFGDRSLQLYSRSEARRRRRTHRHLKCERREHRERMDANTPADYSMYAD